MTCYSRFDYAVQSDQTAQAFVASHGSIQANPFDPVWYPDSGATNHITANLGKLSLHFEYQGNHQHQVGNGIGLRIANIGSSTIHISSTPLKLQDILHVPHITKNPLSISQLTKDNDVYCEFHVNDYFIKDRATGQTLLRGRTKDELYYLPLPISTKKTLVGEKASFEQWHRRLGHSSKRIVRSIITTNKLPLLQQNNNYSICSSC